ncbi:MAG: COX15/CtaA family protein [Pseudomonadota bacterium]
MAISTWTDDRSIERSGSHVRAVQIWLWAMIGLVFSMIVVGGATRLTDSGLSITEWLPILGVIPPLTESDWQTALEKYRQIPEYQQVNRGMSMAEFQFIYWWEWGHRFLGRMIGLAFAVPLVVFLIRGAIPGRLKPWLIALFFLGGLQGGVGWYMVQSGLVDRVDVSQYRLALHLSIAFLIFGLLIWCVLQLEGARQSMSAAARDYRRIDLRTLPRWVTTIAFGLVVFVFAQVALGAFVAGTKAGLTNTDWPLMGGEWVPSGMWSASSPWWVNAFENLTTIQFNHRVTAYALLALAIWHAASLYRRSDNQAVITSAIFLALALIGQAAIGVATLWSVNGAIPIGWGLAHQGGGAIVLGIAVWHWHRLRVAVR